MNAHSDVELQILEHLRMLREETAVLNVKLQGVEQRLDLLLSQTLRDEAEPDAES